MSWMYLFDIPMTYHSLNDTTKKILEQRKINIFNQCDCNGSTFAHHLPIYILNGSIIHDIDPKKVTCYVNLLFHLVENNKINIDAIDSFNSTPLQVLESLKNSLCGSDAAFCYHYKTLKWILEKKLAIIQQSFVRRWLAIRKAQRLRLHKVLQEITLAPPKQIGLHKFDFFKGGSEYKNHSVVYY